MAMKILLVALLVFVCTGYAKDIPYSLDEDMCGQCPSILSKLKDHTLAQMESLTSEDRLLTLCDLEDPDLQEQCYELLGEHGEEFMEMLKSVDEGLMCEEICKHLEDTDQDDYKLYFQAERGATNTDVEDVGGFACSICKKFMTLIHVYLSNRRNQAIVIRLLKAACRFVPFFHTECNLIVSMYGRLIMNLAARYLSPRLCSTFRLCPRNLPGITCDEPESLADGSVTYDDTALGSTAIYSCNHGYAMMPGDVRRTCGQDGEWTGEAPTCVREQDVLDVWE